MEDKTALVAVGINDRARSAGEEHVTIQNTKAIMANPKFQALVRQRSRLGWTLAVAMCAVYFGLIALVAFDKPFVAGKVGDGPASVGILLGICVILIAAGLVGFYVVVANSRFDKMAAELDREINR
jgi:uncharacterized membrane protein (DUF485 family)